MYRLDWIEQVKLRSSAAPTAGEVARVSPVVWRLGFTSLLTDISAEMVNSVLPAYVVLHLHLSPLQFGAIDGAYHGVAISILALAGGLAADRTRRYKETAIVGYAISGVSKLILLFAAGSWPWLTALVAVDRVGKGIRTSPRDSLISQHSSSAMLASSFAVHRSLDAAGALLGPLTAFVLLRSLPGAFDTVWVTSFVFAALGISVLALLVPNPENPTPSTPPSLASSLGLLREPCFRNLALVGLVLAATTVGDGFLYLILQKRAGWTNGVIPLLYAATATFYMLFSAPVGFAADRLGRNKVLVGGYMLLGLTYLILMLSPSLSVTAGVSCLAVMGLYYAGTEGILMAMASAVIPLNSRTSGLAILGTLIGLGKMLASLLFGWLWHTHGFETALPVFTLALVTSIAFAYRILRPRITAPDEAP